MVITLPFKLFLEVFDIDGLHRHVGGKNKRKFAHIVSIQMEVNSQRRKSYCSIPPTWPP